MPKLSDMGVALRRSDAPSALLRGVSQAGGGGGGIPELVGGQYTGTGQHFGSSHAGLFKVTETFSLAGLRFWQSGDAVLGDGVPKRAVIMNADRSAYLATSEFTTDPLIQGEANDFLFSSAVELVPATNYWAGWEGDGTQTLNLHYQGGASPEWTPFAATPGTTSAAVRIYTGATGSLLASAGEATVVNDYGRFGLLG